jgi:hypothetical protein
MRRWRVSHLPAKPNPETNLPGHRQGITTYTVHNRSQSYIVRLALALEIAKEATGRQINIFVDSQGPGTLTTLRKPRQAPQDLVRRSSWRCRGESLSIELSRTGGFRGTRKRTHQGLGSNRLAERSISMYDIYLHGEMPTFYR